MSEQSSHYIVVINHLGDVITSRESYGEPEYADDGAWIRATDAHGRTVLIFPGNQSVVVITPNDGRR